MEKDMRDKIERRIFDKGLKKEFVAKQIGLDKVRFSQTLSGVRKITSDEYAALCRILGI